MMKSMMVLGALAGAAVAVVACSSSSGGGNGSCGAEQAFSSNDSCYSCLQGSCGSQLSATESGCSDFISCVCGAGADQQAAANCSSKAEESGCQSADQSLETCVQSSCASQCSGGTSSSGGTTSSSGGTTSSSGGTTSSSGGTTSSSGGTGNYTCTTLSSCCSQLPAADQSGCQQLVTDNDQTACSEGETAYVAAGYCH